MRCRFLLCFAVLALSGSTFGFEILGQGADLLSKLDKKYSLKSVSCERYGLATLKQYVCKLTGEVKSVGPGNRFSFDQLPLVEFIGAAAEELLLLEEHNSSGWNQPISCSRGSFRIPTSCTIIIGQHKR